MKISYAITVCSELSEYERLLEALRKHTRPEDEVVVLVDSGKGCFSEVNRISTESGLTNITCHSGVFEGNFGEWKNSLNSLCKGDYIFQIDADEVPSSELLTALPQILENNNVDVIWVPRENRVEGLTQGDIAKWYWNVSSDGLVNWPDYQSRIYVNNPQIHWEGRVHEQLWGFLTFGRLPALDFKYSLQHYKKIEKQRSQNGLYDKLLSTKNITAVVGANKNWELTKTFYTTFRQYFPVQPLILSAIGAPKEFNELREFEKKDPNLTVLLGRRVDGHDIAFSEVYNAGINAVTTEYLVLLHTDMVLAPDFFEKLKDFLKPGEFSSYVYIEPPKPVVDPRPGKIVEDFGSSFSNFDSQKFINRYRSFERPYTSDPAFIINTFFLAGSKELFEKVGGYDQERFKVFCEDVDFCIRVMHAGYRIALNPQAIVYHFGSLVSRTLPSDASRKIEFESLKAFNKKWSIDPRDFWTHRVDSMTLPYRDSKNYLSIQRRIKYIDTNE